MMEIITHLVVFGVGIVIGMYCVTQIEKDINKRINNK
jgi:hypothetical protein